MSNNKPQKGNPSKASLGYYLVKTGSKVEKIQVIPTDEEIASKQLTHAIHRVGAAHGKHPREFVRAK